MNNRPSQLLTLDEKIESHYQKGRDLCNKEGKYLAALDEFNAALALKKDHWGSLYYRGFCYQVHHKDYRKAISEYEQALKINPTFADVYYQQGMCYLLLKENEKALLCFNQSLKLYPTYAVGYYRRSNVYFNLGDFKHAEEDINEAIRLNPSHSDFPLFKKTIQFKLQAQKPAPIQPVLKPFGKVFGEALMRKHVRQTVTNTEFSVEMPAGKGKLTVNYDASNAKASVTCSLPSKPAFSYQVKESASGNHSFTDFQALSGHSDNITVIVSKNLIDQEMHAIQHIPASERKEAAMVSVSAKAIRDFQESLSQPERLANAAIKDNDHAIAVGDQLVKSDIKIAYNQNMLAAKTSSTQWGFSIVSNAHSSSPTPEKSKAIASILEMADSALSFLKPLSLVGQQIPGVKQASAAVDYAKRVLASEEEPEVKILCAGLGTSTKYIGSVIATKACGIMLETTAAAAPPTAGLSLFAVPVIGFVWLQALKGINKGGDAVQNACENVFKASKDEKSVNVNKDKTFILGTKIQLGANTFFPFPPVIQPTSLLENKTSILAAAPMSSIAVVRTKLVPAPKPSYTGRRLSQEQTATLAKEKAQTALYYQAQAKASQNEQVPQKATQTKAAPVAKPIIYTNSVTCNGMTVFTSGGGSVSSDSKDYFGGGCSRSDDNRQSYDSCGRMR